MNARKLLAEPLTAPVPLGCVSKSQRERIAVMAIARGLRQHVLLKVERLQSGQWAGVGRSIALPLERIPELVATLQLATPKKEG